jgi:homoserine O-succinyltransferase/O-acetyltransferase
VAVRLSQAAATRPDASLPEEADRADWTCAFVNNMPDGAFDATERQFLDLLETGSGTDVIAVRRYALAGVPRGERIADRIAADYLPVETMLEDPPDILIVTGSNPVEERIEDEPYWTDLSDLVTWGSEHVQSMLLSCLSAHAALTVFEGIGRERLASKCTGVFDQEVDPAHPLAAGLEPRIILPHSRTSTVPEEQLRAAGYQIAVRSDTVGWAVATRQVGTADVVLVQGHPEYDPSSLLREYHRDVRRYAQYERDEPPILPLHCVAAEDWDELKHLHDVIVGGKRDPELVAAYPFNEVGARAPWGWHGVAERLYANWVDGFTKRSD